MGTTNPILPSELPRFCLIDKLAVSLPVFAQVVVKEDFLVVELGIDGGTIIMALFPRRKFSTTSSQQELLQELEFYAAEFLHLAAPVEGGGISVESGLSMLGVSFSQGVHNYGNKIWIVRALGNLSQTYFWLANWNGPNRPDALAMVVAVFESIEVLKWE